jgi:hypothetical protein
MGFVTNQVQFSWGECADMVWPICPIPIHRHSGHLAEEGGASLKYDRGGRAQDGTLRGIVSPPWSGPGRWPDLKETDRVGSTLRAS